MEIANGRKVKILKIFIEKYSCALKNLKNQKNFFIEFENFEVDF